MPDETGGAPDGATATPTPAVGTTTATTPAAVTAPEIAAPSKGDWAGLAKNLRDQAAQIATLTETLSKLAPQAKPAEPAKPAAGGDAMAAVEQLRFELDLERAFGVHAIPATHPVRELILAAAKASKPTDVGEFVGRYAKLAAASAPPAAPVKPPIAPSDTGAPAPPPSSPQLPDNPLSWPAEVVSKMSQDEWNDALRKWDQKNGRGNPLRSMRESLDKRIGRK